MQIREVLLSDIKICRQGLRVGVVDQDLVKSIREVGLLTPLTINEDHELIAGGRRYTALKELKWRKVKVVVLQAAQPEQKQLFEELAHIDENLVRLSLTDSAAEEALLRRKNIYEMLYPETKRGVAGAMAKNLRSAPASAKLSAAQNSFVKDTANKTGKSERTLERAITRAQMAAPKVKEARERGEVSAGQVDELVKLNNTDQEELLPLIKGKRIRETKNVIVAVQDKGIDEAKEALRKNNLAINLIADIRSLCSRLSSLLNQVVSNKVEFSGSTGLEAYEFLLGLKAKLDYVITLQNVSDPTDKTNSNTEPTEQEHEEPENEIDESDLESNEFDYE